MNRSQELPVLAAALSVALTACGQKKEEASPVAMKANGQVITGSEMTRQREEIGPSPNSGPG
jgi:uncharacterized lipoprotein YehR (DUF1307 family)